MIRKIIVILLFIVLAYQLSQVEINLEDDKPKGLNLVYLYV